jgi:rSAM/selenodomain-associated transferase 2
LLRSNRIDGASGLFIVKDAIPVLLFPQATIASNEPGTHGEKFVEGLITKIGERSRFVLVDPHIPRRAGAACTATRAGEAETFVKPCPFRFHTVDLMEKHPDISVIIPVLNEARCIAQTLESLRAAKPREIIVVDGGSHDATPEQAQRADLLVASPPGRAIQMNSGAAQARGDLMLFLHADCSLEANWAAAIERCLANKKVIAGCFSMRTRADGILYRSIDWCATARVRLTGLIYGDQGLFLRRRDFMRIGGFPSFKFMEDVFFSRTLRRLGRIEVVPQTIFVSPRRWQRYGLVRQTLRNWTLTGLASAGVPPDQLARYYPTVR